MRIKKEISDVLQTAELTQFVEGNVAAGSLFSTLTSGKVQKYNPCEYSTGNERQTPTGGTISEQIYLGFTKNKHSTDILSPRAIAHKLFSFQLLKRGPWKKVVHPPSTTFPPLSFDKEFHPLYIDFMLKYFQN